MQTTLFGLFETNEAVKAVYDELLRADINPRDIGVYRRNNTQELNALKNSVDDPDVDFYIESVQHGDTLISVDSPEDKVNQVADIFSRYDVIDVDARAENLRSQGSNVQLRDYRDNDHVLQVVEETLAVGKREVERGRVRVYNRITERVVEEQIGLRDETINVARRPVDRELSGAELESAFQERSYEMREIDEEAVVGKVARVVEEVTISKDVVENIETIRDTVRRSDVQVEEYSGVQQYSDYDADFHTYYNSELGGSGLTYEQYSPAFRYGHQLADRYRGRNWTEVEPEARRIWEERNPSTWDRFTAAIRHAFNRVNNR